MSSYSETAPLIRPITLPLPQGGMRALSDAIAFFRLWLRNPSAIAAVAPSSRWLAALIAREIDPRMGPILELGSGTGAFVPAILARGVAARDLTLFELDPSLAYRLARRFPAARIVNGDAAELSHHVGVNRFGAVVCGLGLLNMPPSVIETILSEAFAHMRPAARFYLFTYGRRCSVPDEILERLDLRVDRMGTAWANLPPATVFRLTRRSAP